MKVTESLASALRALSSVPDLPSKELKRFSESLHDGLPSANASIGENHIWRIQIGSEPPDAFRELLRRLYESDGLVQLGDFCAIRLAEVALVFSQSTLYSLIREASQERLTGSETRTAIQLLSGHTLKSAAQTDAVGYETKRTHFKILAAKLGLRGQTEVVRVLTARLFERLVHLSQTHMHADLDLYASSYLPKSVRRQFITVEGGTSVPVLDYGPASGKPLIVLHPMIFPPIGADEVAFAEETGLRLLWPLRAGLLDRSAPHQSGQQHLDTSVKGLIAVLDQIVAMPTPVLALVSSGAVATLAAQQRPDMISSICFASTCYSAGKNGVSFRYFGASLVELALRNETMMSRTVTALRNYADTDKRFRTMVETVFQSSRRDLEHISSDFSGADAGKRLRLAILNSAESIKQDFFNQTHFQWDELSKLKTPVRFIQGSDDAIHPPAELMEIVRKIDGASLTVANGMGHLPHHNDLRQVVEFATSEA